MVAVSIKLAAITIERPANITVTENLAYLLTDKLKVRRKKLNNRGIAIPRFMIEMTGITGSMKMLIARIQEQKY